MKKTEDANEKNKIEQYREQIQVEVLGSIENNGDLIATKIKDNIENHISGASVDGADFDLDVTVDGYIFSINSSGNVAYNGKKAPTEPVTNPYSNEDWVMAWVCKNNAWESTPITSSNEADLDDADIVAKLYEVKTNGIANKITPKSFFWQGETISFKEGTEYHMVIEGSGEMPALMTNEESNITGAFGWQAPDEMYIMKYLMTHTMPDDRVFTPYITEVIVCEGITKIGDYAFSGATGLKNVQFASTVKEIGEYCFMMCDGLTSISIPSSVTSISNYAFLDCQSLAKVKILSKNLENLSVDTFYDVKFKDNIKFYVLDDNTKKKLTNDCDIPESKIEIVTESQMNSI